MVAFCEYFCLRAKFSAGLVYRIPSIKHARWQHICSVRSNLHSTLSKKESRVLLFALHFDIELDCQPDGEIRDDTGV